jgi:hypothetical protein
VLWIPGQLPFREDGQLHKGKVGGATTPGGQSSVLDVKGGTEAARAVALTTLAVLRAELGSLDVVRRVVEVRACVPPLVTLLGVCLP